MSVSVSNASIGVAKEPKRHSFLGDLGIRLWRDKPLGTVGGFIVLILLLTGIFANFIAPFGMNEIILEARLIPPGRQFLLGGDNLGRDLLSRIIYGARISMYVGLGGAMLDAGLATLIGIISGFLGGKTDLVTQRIVDAFMCFPPLFLYLTIMALLGPGLLQVIVVLGVVQGIRHSRTVRSAVLGIKGNMYVEAAKAIARAAATDLGEGMPGPTPASIESMLRQRALAGRTLKPGDRAEGFVYFPTGTYARARATLIDVESGEGEGFLVEF